MRLTEDKLTAFISEIESKGYKEYPGQDYQNCDRIWWKNLHNKKDGTIIGVALYDFSKYAKIDNYYKEYPYSVMYCSILEENSMVPREDIIFSGFEDYSVEQFEKYVSQVENISLT